MEAVRTNVEGTDNMLHAAIDCGVKRVVCLSTDKAAYPINAMGISKAMMEHVIYANARGSFTELLKTANCGQFSVNISKPGITKGQHWHNSKWEFFIVVSGRALIEERNIHTNEKISFEVSGDKIVGAHPRVRPG